MATTPVKKTSSKKASVSEDAGRANRERPDEPKPYQARKEEMVDHRVLGQKVRLGLVPSIQARLFARALRADMPAYVPFTVRM